MPTKLEDIAATAITSRYRTPLVTESLNQKLAVHTPHGIYRGFKMGTSASVLTVDVNPDPDANDHVCAVQTLDGYNLTVRKTGGLFSLDLSAYANKEVVIAVFVEYAVGADTYGEIRAYELSPSDEFTGASERAELVVLGWVEVPAAGLISYSRIKPLYRTSAWQFEAPGRVPWRQMLEDPSFEWAEDGMNLYEDSHRVWQVFPLSGSIGNWYATTAASKYGGKSLAFYWANAGSHTGYLFQGLDAPVLPGQHIYVRFWIKNLAVPTGGVVGITLDMADTDLGTATPITLVVIDLSSVDADFRLVEAEYEIPAVSTAAFIRRVQLTHSGLTYSGAGDKYYLDCLELFLEEKGQFIGLGDTLRRPVATSRLTIERNQPGAFTDDAAQISMDPSNPRMNIGRRGTSWGLEVALGQLALGEGDIGTATRAALARITAPGIATSFTLLWETEISSTQVLRLYSGSGAQFIITMNARWDGADWNSDDVGDTASKYVYDRDNLTAWVYDTCPASWLDTAWPEPPMLPTTGQLRAGSALNSSDAEAATTPRYAPSVRSTKITLLQESGGPSNGKLRFFSGALNELFITYNAYFSSTVWQADDISLDSQKFVISRYGMLGYSRAAGAGTWSESAWDESIAHPTVLSNFGGNVLGSVAEAARPRIAAPGLNGTFTCMWESEVTSSEVGRLYVSSNGEWVITLNARWDGSNWNSDNVGAEAWKYEFNYGSFVSWFYETTPASWSNGSWPEPPMLRTAGRLDAGLDLLSSDAEAATVARFWPRIRSNTFTLVRDWGDAFNGHTRLFSGADNEWVLTYNASYSGTVWTADQTSEDSRKVVFGEDGMTAFYRPAGAGTWADGAWTSEKLDVRSLIDNLGANLLGTADDAALARITAPLRNSAFNLLWESKAPGTYPGTRLYCGYSGQFIYTYNAKWDSSGSVWEADDAGGDDAWIYEFGTQGLTVQTKAAPPASWANTAWDSPELMRLMSVLEVGNLVTGSTAEAAIPRLKPRIRTATYTLLIDLGGATASAHGRLYSNASLELVVTFNAEWDGTDWNADNTADNAQKYTFGELGLTTDYKASGTATWLDSAWDKKPFDFNALLNLDIGGRVSLGGELDDLPAQAQGARLDIDWSGVVGGRTCIFRSAGASGGPKFRLWRDVDGSGEDDIWITTNAYWNGVWNADDNTKDSTAIRLNSGVLYLEKRNAGAGTWTDLTWDATTSEAFMAASVTGNKTIRSFDRGMDWSTATYGATKGNPPYNQTLLNDLRAKGVVKCWGKITVTAGVITNIQGINIASASIGTGALVITFASGMIADTGSGSSITSGGVGLSGTNPTELLQCTSVIPASMTITMFNSTTGATVPINGGSITTYIRFILFASQGSSA